MKTGIELIAEERARQIEKEGWTSLHDLEHSEGELSIAAACYALPERERFTYMNMDNFFVAMPYMWPWDRKWWKPSPEARIRELQKAGALIAAEIDRLNKNR